MKTIPADKANHHTLASWATFAGVLVAGVPGGTLTCAAAVLGRELYNVWRAGWDWRRWSWADVAWGVAGGLVVLAAAAIGGA